MKKIITLILLTAGTISIAAAQSKNPKDIAWNDNKKTNDHIGQQPILGMGTYNDSYNFSVREKEAKLQKINTAFDRSIAAVKNNRRLNRWEKAKQIQKLEDQRRSEILQVEKQFAKNDHKANDKTKGHDTKRW